MFISLEILKKFVDLDGIDPKEIADKITEHSFEVDDCINKADSFKNVVVGKIEKVESHPSADKLRVCDVLISKVGGLLNKKEKIVKIVCGGSNLEKGMFVVVALPGSFVKWHGEGELVEIKETELRGVASYGMICASSEIGLSDIFPEKSEKEIIDLNSFKDKINKDIKVGENIADLLDLNSVSFDVDNVALTHRPDLWGHYGVARELSVIYKRELKSLDFSDLSNGIYTQLKIEVLNNSICKNYNAVKINNIKVEESPEWLKKAMISIGHNSINNIVDLTNYVMIELGQPLHAYDASKISNKIFVRNAKTGEKIKTLDKKEIILDESTLIISDSIRPIGIAGVMGGEESCISNSTNSIVLESANFDGTSIRKTMQKFGLRTDAGARYEKQIDPEFANIALARFIYLLKTICPKVVIEAVQKYQNYNTSSKTISISFDFIKSRVGADISNMEVTSILKRLGFVVDEQNESIDVTVPYFRNKDINIKEDLIEEIARIYGYNNIKPEPLDESSYLVHDSGLRKFEKRVKEIMIDNGFSEVLNYSFISSDDQKEFGFKDSEVVKVLNPLSSDTGVMRPVLAINLLKNIKNNLKNFDNVKIFEIERIFRDDIESDKFGSLPFQNYYFSAFFTEENIEVPFYSLKNYLEKLFSLFKLDITYSVACEIIPSYCHPSRFAEIVVDGLSLGFISEINPKLTSKDKIKQRISFFELDFEKMYELFEEKYNYSAISKFQGSDMDISMITDKRILWQDIKKEVLSISPLISSAELFDVYNGENIDNDKISLAFRISLLDKEKTMTNDIIENVYNNVIDMLKTKFNAEIRK